MLAKRILERCFAVLFVLTCSCCFAEAAATGCTAEILASVFGTLGILLLIGVIAGIVWYCCFGKKGQTQLDDIELQQSGRITHGGSYENGGVVSCPHCKKNFSISSADLQGIGIENPTFKAGSHEILIDGPGKNLNGRGVPDGRVCASGPDFRGDIDGSLHGPKIPYIVGPTIETSIQRPDDCSLGLVIAKEKGFQSPAMFVREVVSGSPTAEAGILEYGDEIVGINGVKTKGMPHQKAMNMIRTSPDGRVDLTIVKNSLDIKTKMREGSMPNVRTTAPDTRIDIPEGDLSGPNVNIKGPSKPNQKLSCLSCCGSPKTKDESDYGYEMDAAGNRGPSKPNQKLSCLSCCGSPKTKDESDYGYEMDAAGNRGPSKPNQKLSCLSCCGSPKTKDKSDYGYEMDPAEYRRPKGKFDIGGKGSQSHVVDMEGGINGPDVDVPDVNGISNDAFHSPDLDVDLRTSHDVRASEPDFKGPEVEVPRLSGQGSLNGPSFDGPQGSLRGPELDLDGPQFDMPKGDASFGGPKASLQGPGLDVEGAKIGMPKGDASFGGRKGSLKGSDLDVDGPKIGIPKGSLQSPDVNVNGPEFDLPNRRASFGGPTGSLQGPDLDVDGAKFGMPTGGTSFEGPSGSAGVNIKGPKISGKGPSGPGFDTSVDGPEIPYIAGPTVEAIVLKDDHGGLKFLIAKEPGFPSPAMFIRKVFVPSAEIGGIEPGDEIVGINGKLIKGKTHEESMNMIRNAPSNKVDLTIVKNSRNTKANMKWKKPHLDHDVSGGSVSKPSMKSNLSCCGSSKPRGESNYAYEMEGGIPGGSLEHESHLTPTIEAIAIKDDNGDLKFLIAKEPGFPSPAMFIRKVFVPSAEIGGIEPGDEIVGINGKSIKGKTHEESMNMIRNTPINKVDFTIVKNSLNAKANMKWKKPHLDHDVSGGSVSKPSMKSNLSCCGSSKPRGESNYAYEMEGGIPAGSLEYEESRDIKDPGIKGPKGDLGKRDLKIRGPNAPSTDGEIDGPGMDVRGKEHQVNIHGPDFVGGIKGPSFDGDIDGADMDVNGPGFKRPKGAFSGKGGINLQGDIDSPDIDIERPGFNGPDVKGPAFKGGVNGPDMNINGPEFSTPKAGLGGPDLKGPSFVGIDRPEANIRGPGFKGPNGKTSAESPDFDAHINGPSVKSPKGPKVKGPKFNWCTSPEGTDDSDHEYELPSGSAGYKIPKGSGNIKGPQTSIDADVDGGGGIGGPDVDISDPRGPSFNGNIDGPDLDVRGPGFDGSIGKMSGPSINTNVNGPSVKSPKKPKLKGPTFSWCASPKGTDSDNDYELPSGSVEYDLPEGGTNIKGPRFDVDDADLKVRTPGVNGFNDIDLSGPGKASLDGDIEGPDLRVPGGGIKGSKGKVSAKGPNMNADINGPSLKSPRKPKLKGPNFSWCTSKGGDDSDHEYEIPSGSAEWKGPKGGVGIAGTDFDTRDSGGDIDINPKITGFKKPEGKKFNIPSLDGPELTIDGPKGLKVRKEIDVPDMQVKNRGFKGPGFKGPDLDGPSLGGSIDTPDVDIKGPDLDGPSLGGSIGISDVDIKGPKFKGPGLKGPDFDGPSLGGSIDSPDVDLKGPDFDGPSLKGPSLGGSIDTPDVDLKGPKFKGPDFDGQFLGGSIDTPDVDFKGPDFDGPSLGGSIDTPDVDIKGPKFKGPGFKGPNLGGSIDTPDVDLKGPKFKGPDFDGPSFGGSIDTPDLDIKGPKFKGPGFKGPNFGGPSIGGSIDTPDVDIKGPKFKGPGFKGPNFGGPSLGGSIDTPDVDLKGPNLDGPSLKGPSLGGSIDTPDVDLKGPGFKGPDFDGPSLGGSIDTPDVDIKGPKFKGPGFKGPNLGGPSLGGSIDTPVVDLKGPDFDGPSLGGSIDTPDVDIKGPKFKGPGFKGPNFGGPSLGGSIDTPDVDIKGPKFKGPGFKGPNFGGPSLGGSIDTPDVDLKGPNLDGPSLKGPSLGGSIDTPDVDLKGPGFKGPDFDGPSLGGSIDTPDVDIKGPKFKGPGFKGPNLGGPSLGGSIDTPVVDLKGPDFDGPSLGGSIDTPDVDIKGPKFKGPGFKGPNFGGPSLGGSIDTPDVDLKGPKFKGPDFDGPSFGGSIDTPDLDIKGPKFKGPGFKGPNFGGPSIGGSIDTPDVDIKGPKFKGPGFKGPNFGGPSLGGSIDTPDVDLKGPNLDGPSLKGPSLGGSIDTPDVDLKGPGFKGPDFDGPSLGGSIDTPDVDIKGPKFKGPGFKGPNLGGPSLGGSIDTPVVDLKGPDFDGPSLGGSIDTPDVDIKGPKFKGPGFKGPNFGGPSLGGSIDTPDVDIKGPKFKGPGFKGPNFGGPSLGGSIDTPDVDLKGPNLDGPSLKGPSLGGSIDTPDVDLKGPGFKGPDFDGPSLGGSIDTPDVDIKGPKFKGPGFKGPNLGGPSLGGSIDTPVVDLKGPDFDGPSLGGSIDTPDVDIKGPKFKGPGFKGPNFGGPSLGGSIDTPDVDLKGPKFKGPDFDGPSFGGRIATPAVDTKGPKFKGPGFKGPNFGGPSLGGSIDTPDVDLKGPKFKGPDFDGPSFGGSIDTPDVDLKGPDFDGPSLGGSIDTPDVDIRGPKFKGPGFKGPNFGGPSLGGSIDTPDVDLKGPKFKGPDFDGPSLGGSIGIPDVDIKGPGFKGRDFDGPSVDEDFVAPGFNINAPGFNISRGEIGSMFPDGEGEYVEVVDAVDIESAPQDFSDTEESTGIDVALDLKTDRSPYQLKRFDVLSPNMELKLDTTRHRYTSSSSDSDTRKDEDTRSLLSEDDEGNLSLPRIKTAGSPLSPRAKIMSVRETFTVCDAKLEKGDDDVEMAKTEVNKPKIKIKQNIRKSSSSSSSSSSESETPLKKKHSKRSGSSSSTSSHDGKKKAGKGQQIEKKHENSSSDEEDDSKSEGFSFGFNLPGWKKKDDQDTAKPESELKSSSSSSSSSDEEKRNERLTVQAKGDVKNTFKRHAVERKKSSSDDEKMDAKPKIPVIEETIDIKRKNSASSLSDPSETEKKESYDLRKTKVNITSSSSSSSSSSSDSDGEKEKDSTSIEKPNQLEEIQVVESVNSESQPDFLEDDSTLEVRPEEGDIITTKTEVLKVESTHLFRDSDDGTLNVKLVPLERQKPEERPQVSSPTYREPISPTSSIDSRLWEIVQGYIDHSSIVNDDGSPTQNKPTSKEDPIRIREPNTDIEDRRQKTRSLPLRTSPIKPLTGSISLDDDLGDPWVRHYTRGDRQAARSLGSSGASSTTEKLSKVSPSWVFSKIPHVRGPMNASDFESSSPRPRENVQANPERKKLVMDLEGAPRRRLHDDMFNLNKENPKASTTDDHGRRESRKLLWELESSKTSPSPTRSMSSSPRRSFTPDKELRKDILVKSRSRSSPPTAVRGQLSSIEVEIPDTRISAKVDDTRERRSLISQKKYELSTHLPALESRDSSSHDASLTLSQQQQLDLQRRKEFMPAGREEDEPKVLSIRERKAQFERAKESGIIKSTLAQRDNKGATKTFSEQSVDVQSSAPYLRSKQISRTSQPFSDNRRYTPIPRSAKVTTKPISRPDHPRDSLEEETENVLVELARGRRNRSAEDYIQGRSKGDNKYGELAKTRSLPDPEFNEVGRSKDNPEPYTHVTQTPKSRTAKKRSKSPISTSDPRGNPVKQMNSKQQLQPSVVREQRSYNYTDSNRAASPMSPELAPDLDRLAVNLTANPSMSAKVPLMTQLLIGTDTSPFEMELDTRTSRALTNSRIRKS